jgi:hypothetical protein
MKIDSRQEAIGLPPLNEIAREVRDVMLDPTSGLPPEARAILRTELGMSPETASNKPATNAAPASAIPPRAN